jgi:hypothetical protein
MSTKPDANDQSLNIDRQQLEKLGEHFKANVNKPTPVKPPMTERDLEAFRHMAAFLDM